jgi:O-6-methylguanine DNA methyltransferase
MFYQSQNSSFGPIQIIFDDTNTLKGLSFGGKETLKELAPHSEFKEKSLPFNIPEAIQNKSNISLDPEGTPFQKMVWQHLQSLTKGITLSYEELALQIFKDSRYTRPVASAVASNPISWLIPCHRILPKNGGIGQYRWGSSLKEALLNYERN